jgi:nitrite reductase/ring-hydroxylating ferredoxin subunit
LLGGVFGVAVALAGCGSGEPATPAPTGPPAVPGGPPGALIALADVPVGGGVIAPGRVLVVQLEEGEVLAYDAICPHQAITIGTPDATGTITCPGHLGRFRAADGSRIDGPAPSGLRAIAVQVSDGYVVRS